MGHSGSQSRICRCDLCLSRVVDVLVLHICLAIHLSTEVVVLGRRYVVCCVFVWNLRSIVVASPALVPHYILWRSLGYIDLGDLRLCTPSRLLFPQSVGAAFLVFCLRDLF